MRRMAASPFDRYSEQIEGLMCAGELLTEVEATIDGLPLPEEQKAALWLVAWSLGERPVWRRSLARQTEPVLGRP